MKKNVILAATAAIVLSSCSKNNVTETFVSADNVNTIGMALATGATKGVEATTALVETSDELVLSYYGVDAESGKDVNGDLTMAYNASNDAWDQTATDKKLWSELALPASFYSMHAGTNSLTATSTSKTEASYPAYTPVAAIESHEDIVYYSGIISSMPAAGYIRGNFHHALSRIEIYSNQGKYNPYVMAVDFMNLKNSGEATLTASAHTDAPADKGTIDCVWKVAATSTDYSYMNRIATGIAQKTDDGHLFTNAAETTPTAATNMMIIPQPLVDAYKEITTLDGSGDPVVDATVTAETVKANAAYASITGSYVKVLYRMRDAEDAGSVVGYFRAGDCSDYNSMIEAKKPVYPTTINKESHLYVLVGFPFANGQTFEVGKDYDVKLGLGINGGYLLYDYYFDVNGDPTNIKIAGIDVNDPVINENAPIGIMVTVKDWVSAGSVVTE